MELQYKKYSPEYKNQVIDLLDNLWHFPYEEKLAYFKWKFEDNPYTDEVLGFVALDGDRVVSYRGYTVMPIIYKGCTYLSAALSDAVTHPDYRRKGIFQELTNYSINEILKDDNYIVSINTSSGGPTVGGHIKLGWKPFSKREHIFRFTFRGLLNYKLLKKEYDINKDIATTEENWRYRLTTENKPSDIASMGYEYKFISHKRDEEFYSWRFKNPHNKFLFAYMYDGNNKLLAYMVFAGISDARFDIVDFNCENEKYLKKLLGWVCRKAHPFCVSLWTVGKNNYIYNNKLCYGFLVLRPLLNLLNVRRNPPFVVRNLKGDDGDMYNPYAWDLYKLIGDEI